MTIDRLYKNFEILSDWQGRYRFIIEMGQKIPKLDPADMTEENRVHGCMSRVYMVVRITEDDPPKITFVANSDAAIVNGLIAILQIVYGGKTIEEIRGININEIMARLGLTKHLSPIRRNGFYSMVERLSNLASQATL